MPRHKNIPQFFQLGFIGINNINLPSLWNGFRREDHLTTQQKNGQRQVVEDNLDLLVRAFIAPQRLMNDQRNIPRLHIVRTFFYNAYLAGNDDLPALCQYMNAKENSFDSLFNAIKYSPEIHAVELYNAQNHKKPSRPSLLVIT